MALSGAGDLSSVFPSGRAAIGQCLDEAAISPSSPVGILGARSECLVRTVRRLATPVELPDWQPSDIAALVALIVYEPWGWPVLPGVWQQLAAHFRGQLLIVDRVESADYFFRRESGTVEVLSLSKVLGLAGGGVARGAEGDLRFRPRGDSPAIRHLLQRPVEELAHGAYAELFKSSRQAAHPSVIDWMQTHCLSSAVERERQRRQEHLAMLLDSGLTDEWTPWMKDAIERGAGPSIAPILPEADPALRWEAARVLLTAHGVESSLSQFNWSGDPMRPHYGPCLALPVHGRVDGFASVVATLRGLASSSRRKAA